MRNKKVQKNFPLKAGQSNSFANRFARVITDNREIPDPLFSENRYFPSGRGIRGIPNILYVIEALQK